MPFKKTGMLCASILLAACNNNQVTIESPAKGELFVDNAPVFEVSWDEPQTNVTYWLNGFDISEYFQQNNEGATAQHNNLSDFLIDGKNNFQVTTANGNYTSLFYFDESGPIIHVTQVNRNNTAMVNGYLSDYLPVTDFAINHVATNLLTDNSYSGEFQDDGLVVFTASDSADHQTSTSYADLSKRVNDAMHARVSEKALDIIVAELEKEMANMDYGEVMRKMNPLWEKSLLGSSATIDAVDASGGAPQIVMKLGEDGSNQMHVIVTVPDLFVDIVAYGKVGFVVPWQATGDISANPGIFETTVALSTDGDGNIIVDVEKLKPVLEDFHFNIDGMPSELEELARYGVRPVVEMALAYEFKDRMSEELTTLFNGMINDLIFALNGHSQAIRALPQSIAVDHGGLLVNIFSEVEVLTPSDMPESIGFVFRDYPSPQLQSTSQHGYQYDIGASISTNMINQILQGAYEGEMLNLTTDMNAAELGNVGDILATEDSPAMRATILPSSAPYIQLVDSKVANGRLIFNDFHLLMEYLPKDSSEFKPLFGAVVNMRIPFNFAINPDNTFAFHLTGIPDLQIVSVDEAAIKLPQSMMQDAVDGAALLLAPKITDAVEQVSVPLFADYNLQLKDVWLDDNLTYILIAGDMVR